MMPITRHQIIHLNDCFKIKQKYNKLMIGGEETSSSGNV